MVTTNTLERSKTSDNAQSFHKYIVKRLFLHHHKHLSQALWQSPWHGWNLQQYHVLLWQKASESVLKQAGPCHSHVPVSLPLALITACNAMINCTLVKL